MPFVRILMLIVGLLALAVIGFAALRPDPAAEPQAKIAPPPRERPALAPVRSAPPSSMSPADASSPAEMTARETEETVRRLQKEQENPQMMVPDDIGPIEVAPDRAPPVK